MDKQDNLRGQVMGTLAHQVRAFLGSAREEGYSVLLNRVRRIIDSLLTPQLQDPKLAAIERYFSFYISVFQQCVSMEFFYVTSGKIIDELSLDEGTKGGLKLSFRALSVEDVTLGGYMISAEKLTEQISVLKELAPDLREEFVNRIRSAYYNLLTVKYAARAETFLDELAQACEEVDLDKVYDLLNREIIDLNDVSNHSAYFGGLNR